MIKLSNLLQILLLIIGFNQLPVFLSRWQHCFQICLATFILQKCTKVLITQQPLKLDKINSFFFLDHLRNMEKVVYRYKIFQLTTNVREKTILSFPEHIKKTFLLQIRSFNCGKVHLQKQKSRLQQILDTQVHVPIIRDKHIQKNSI